MMYKAEVVEGKTSVEVMPLLLCFSHLRWNFVYQRPQHLMSRAVLRHQVVFFEEPIFEAGVAARLHLAMDASGVTVATPVLPTDLAPEAICSLQRNMLRDLPMRQNGAPLITWYYSPMALSFSSSLVPDLCIYDCMDELSGFRGAPPGLRDYERKLFARADLVFTGGVSLFEAKRREHPDVHAFPSSVDVAHFVRARSSQRRDPADQAGIAHPRLGFFGVIDERMDLDLVSSAADLRPDWQFVFIGPVVKIDPASLPQRPNIHWLGHKHYADLPSYIGGWDVGIMPFARNEATRFISPTKTPEFLSAGVPVVSTPIVDVIRAYGEQGLVEIASDATSMLAKAAAILERPHGRWLEKVDAKLASMSWDQTWQEMFGLMQAVPRRARHATSRLPVAAERRTQGALSVV